VKGIRVDLFQELLDLQFIQRFREISLDSRERQRFSGIALNLALSDQEPKKIFNATTMSLIEEAESPARLRSARYSLIAGKVTERGSSILFLAAHHRANSLSDLWVES